MLIVISPFSWSNQVAILTLQPLLWCRCCYRSAVSILFLHGLFPFQDRFGLVLVLDTSVQFFSVSRPDNSSSLVRKFDRMLADRGGGETSFHCCENSARLCLKSFVVEKVGLLWKPGWIAAVLQWSLIRIKHRYRILAAVSVSCFSPVVRLKLWQNKLD